jgi:hypothetical protein
VQYFINRFNKWAPLVCQYSRKKDAKDALRNCEKIDKEVDKTFKYRIVKLTIKKEIVK